MSSGFWHNILLLFIFFFIFPIFVFYLLLLLLPLLPLSTINFVRVSQTQKSCVCFASRGDTKKSPCALFKSPLGPNVSGVPWVSELQAPHGGSLLQRKGTPRFFSLTGRAHNSRIAAVHGKWHFRKSNQKHEASQSGGISVRAGTSDIPTKMVKQYRLPPSSTIEPTVQYNFPDSDKVSISRNHGPNQSTKKSKKWQSSCFLRPTCLRVIGTGAAGGCCHASFLSEGKCRTSALEVASGSCLGLS